MNMKIAGIEAAQFCLIGLLFYMLTETDLYSQWSVDYCSDSYFNYVSAVDSITAWAVGSNHSLQNLIVRRNPNGTWDSIPRNGIFDSHNLTCIAAKDYLTAWVGDGDGGSANGGAHIYRTTNGGINWILQVSTGGRFGNINGIVFSRVHPSYGYAWSNPPDSNGTPLKIYKTTDTGNSWSEYSVTVDSRFVGTERSICVTDSSHVWFGLNNTTGIYDYYKILYSTNAGLTFTVSNLVVQGYYLQTIEFKRNNMLGIAAAEDQSDYLNLSYNGGSSWTYSLQINLGNAVKLFSVPNSNYWFMVTRSGTPGQRSFKSSNNGSNWRSIDFPDSLFIFLSHMDGVTYNEKVFLYAVDRNGKIFRFVDNVEIIGVNPVSSELPVEYSLSQNYPNPFNPATKISFDLPKSGFVKLTIYDVLGKEVELLVNETLQSAKYEVSFDASNLPSGVYLYKLEADGFVNTKKMILLK